MTNDEPPKIRGKKIELSEGRHVFVGTCSARPKLWFVEFQNSDGALTRFNLSEEAMVAFSDLIVGGRAMVRGVEVVYDLLIPVPHWTVLEKPDV